MTESNEFDPTPPLKVASVGVRTVPASNGVNWVTEAWELFKKAPAPLILAWLLLLVLQMAASLIPFANMLVAPALVAGYILGVIKLSNDQPFVVADLFEGLKTHSAPLLILGAISIVAFLIFVVTTAICVGLVLAGIEARSIGFLIVSLILLPCALTLFLGLVSALWFAPILIVQQQTTAKESIYLALRALGKNLLSFLVFSVLLMLLYTAALIPLGLGLLIVGPLTLLTMYTSYDDIFFLED